MAAFLKIGDIKGEATDSNHPDWVIIQSMTSPITRTIQQGAKDQQRSRGETTAGDIVVVRQLDKSSVKLQEAAATGKYFPKVDVHFTTQVQGSSEPYLKYSLSDVIVTSYNFHGVASGDPQPSEDITLNYSKAEWTYVTIDPKTGVPKGQVVGKYDPGTATAS
jgi:type VI secretion system secreted protein Hcp